MSSFQGLILNTEVFCGFATEGVHGRYAAGHQVDWQ